MQKVTGRAGQGKERRGQSSAIAVSFNLASSHNRLSLPRSHPYFINLCPPRPTCLLLVRLLSPSFPLSPAPLPLFSPSYLLPPCISTHLPSSLFLPPRTSPPPSLPACLVPPLVPLSLPPLPLPPSQLDSTDLIDFGLIPEFVGRFPIHVVLQALTEDQLVQVMHAWEGSWCR